ncbi:hypothetical protein [Bacillus cereus]|uniref:hypothetical protein n=1 Tax=Bacillus cereus TaxID=1396 RepID=UPI002AC2CFF3|nr:hypothetical protein [Bacillus cereus]MDZ4422643.1 hypothetical protein [Bacillus cereus]
MAWNCSYEENEVAISPPPESERIAQGGKSFAEGNAEAFLAKGGPEGIYLWGHLHGIHNDRWHGETNYTITITVTDASGFCYMIADVLKTTVEHRVQQAERHRHCYGQFLPPGQYAEWLKMAIENKRELIVSVDGDRQRDDIEWITSSIKDLIKGPVEELLKRFEVGGVSIGEVLDAINEGKTPSFIS